MLHPSKLEDFKEEYGPDPTDDGYNYRRSSKHALARELAAKARARKRKAARRR